jgi:hypothetical protein
VQGFIQSQRVSDTDHRDTRRAAEIAQHLTDKLMQLCFVEHVPLLEMIE